MGRLSVSQAYNNISYFEPFENLDLISILFETDRGVWELSTSSDNFHIKVDNISGVKSMNNWIDDKHKVRILNVFIIWIV